MANKEILVFKHVIWSHLAWVFTCYLKWDNTPSPSMLHQGWHCRQQQGSCRLCIPQGFTYMEKSQANNPDWTALLTLIFKQLIARECIFPLSLFLFFSWSFVKYIKTFSASCWSWDCTLLPFAVLQMNHCMFATGPAGAIEVICRKCNLLPSTCIQMMSHWVNCSAAHWDGQWQNWLQCWHRQSCPGWCTKDIYAHFQT